MDDKTSEIIIDLYIDIEDRLVNFTKYIPYNDSNKDVFLPLLSSVIVEAGSLIDTIFREEYECNAKRKNNLKIHDFAKYYERKFEFSKIKTLLFIYPPSYFSPYNGWINTDTGKYVTLSWWDNYNKLKHNRIAKYDLSTMELAFKVVCALHQIISRFTSFINALHRKGMISFSGSYNYVKEQIKNEKIEQTLIIESKLFATPLGKYSFPENPNDINPMFFGSSDKLSRFLGKDF